MKQIARFIASIGTIAMFNLVESWGLEGWQLWAVFGWVIAVDILAAYGYGA